MSEPYIGEIRMFAGNFAPLNWAFCDGRLLAISENDALFSLLGTTYGGDGQNTFGLPDLRGRVAVHQGSGFVMGQLAGEENHTLISNEMPAHTHTVGALTTANAKSPTNDVYGGNITNGIYTTAASAQMNAGMVAPAGGSQPHENRMPILAVSYIISLFGIYPSQS